MSLKKCNFVKSSKNNCVHNDSRGRGNKTSKPVHAASNLVFGNIDFDILTFKILGRIKQFSASGQTSETKISFFGSFRGFFPNV